MISKWKYIVVFIILLTGFCYCGVKKYHRQTLKDIYERPIISLLGKNKGLYYSEGGKEIIAYLGGVEFNGGNDSLSNYLLKKYVNHPDYNYEEYNLREDFIVLLNKRLEVEEVRILYRRVYDNERFYYDSIFVDEIKNTTGMWEKTVENKEWYIYFHRQRIY